MKKRHTIINKVFSFLNFFLNKYEIETFSHIIDNFMKLAINIK